MKTLHEIFTENLNRILAECGIKSGAHAQRKTGVSARMINYLRRGELTPTLDTVEKIARGLRRHPLEFLTEQDSN